MLLVTLSVFENKNVFMI